MKFPSFKKPRQMHGVSFINTTELSEIMGLPISSAKLKEYGCVPFFETATGIYWRSSDIPVLAMSFASHLITTACAYQSLLNKDSNATQ